MKRLFLCSLFLFVTTAATTAMGQAGPAGETYGGDRGMVSPGRTAPTKVTGVLDKIERYSNGLKITVMGKDKKEYQYSLWYQGHGPQTALSVDKKVNVELKRLDDLRLEDVVSIKLDGDTGSVKSLVLRERPGEQAKEK